jgi:hypothetical protein
MQETAQFQLRRKTDEKKTRTNEIRDLWEDLPKAGEVPANP